MADKEISFKINVEGVSNEASELAKLEIQLKNLNEERNKFLKQVTTKGHLVSNEDKLVLAAYDREVKNTTESLRGLKKIVDTSETSLERKRQKLIEMKKEYAGASDEVAKKMAPAINKLNTEISKSEQAIGVHTRNVGNYGSAFASLPGPMGRAAGAIQTVNTTMKTLLLNPVVLFITLIVGALAALGKAFLSTDSGGTEFAARFEQIKAILDVVRQRLISVTDAIGHVFKGEWKEAAASFKEAVTGIGEQLKSATDAAYAYQKALDAIGDAENNYVSQSAENRNKIARLEYTAQDRTKSTAERKAALAEAMAIAEEELRMTQDFAKQKLDNEINYLAGKANLNAKDVLEYIRMTDEQQANADESVKKLRNNNEDKFAEIEKLYADWINADTNFYKSQKESISKLSGFEEEEKKKRLESEKEFNKNRLDVHKEYLEKWKKLVEQEKKENEFASEFKKLLGIKEKDLKLQVNKELQDKQKAQSDAFNEYEAEKRKETEEKIVSYKQSAVDAATAGAAAGFEARRSRLQAEMAAELSNENLTEQQKLAIQKKYAKEQQKIAIGEALINGALAIAKIFATVTPLNPLSWVAVAMAGVQTAIQVATIKAQKFATGGRISGGLQIHADTSKDNTLIYVKQNEAVVNERQIAALGGTRAMKAARVPGFAEGGAVGNMPYVNPSMPATSNDIQGMSDRLGRMEVHLDLHKVRSGLNELNTTLDTQPI